MTTSPNEHWPAFAQSIHVTDDTLTVKLAGGRSISVPVGWYPRLAHGTPVERANWRLIGRGEGVYWPDLDEDISVDDLLNDAPSGESRQSFQKWLASRESAT